MTYDKTRLSPSVVSRLQEVVGRDGLLTDMAELDGFVIDWRKNFAAPPMRFFCHATHRKWPILFVCVPN